jgi:AcrR family transcriptional regulator
MTKPSYHHGDLRNALLDAAENLLREQGAGTLTLRACAREAGVSHAAPAHHFGNLSGLLTALAAAGFERLSQYQERAAKKAGAGRNERMAAFGVAYIEFALDHPALFDLMFRDRRIDRKDAAYLEAVRRSTALVNSEIGQAVPSSREQANLQWLRVWSLVHGYATLASTGALAYPDGRPIRASEFRKLARAILQPPVAASKG